MKKIFTLLMSFSMLMAACSDKDIDNPDGDNGGDNGDNGGGIVTEIDYWTLDMASAKQMNIKEENGIYTCVTTGGDPNIQTQRFSSIHKDSVVLTFQYIAPTGIKGFEVFMSPVEPKRSVSLGDLPAASEWTEFSYNLKDKITEFGWGKSGDFLRLDWGKTKDVSFKVRNMYMRSLTDKELEEENAFKMLETTLKDYLQDQYSSSITSVELNTSTNKITVKGTCSGEGAFYLCDIAPYQDVTVEKDFNNSVEINSGSFTVQLDRYVERDGFRYDRNLSKFVIVKQDAAGKAINSHAHYIDKITPDVPGQVFPIKTKKGLGGVSDDYLVKYEQDLVDLGLGSVTFNIVLNNLISSKQNSGYEPYEYCGVKYYINTTRINSMKKSLNTLNRYEISVAGILLVTPTASDSRIGDLLRHPRYTSKGTYTMPNMTNPESVNCYAAVLDYLAKTFSSSTATSRIDHWIMHNEVDAGHVWTNMGDKENTPVTIYLDTYMKSLRMAANIMRQYNSKSEIFASFTHHWTIDEDGNTQGYIPYKMLTDINTYSKIEGDFKWAVAYHSYPQNLREPKTWIDSKATPSKDTHYITFKNLEVIDAWIKLKDNLYQGTTKRGLWLSENGTNSPTYSDKDLREHAAGCVYAFKKINKLDGIDAVAWHRWVDHPTEGGLLMGLRKLDDATNLAAKKPAFEVFAKLNTDREDELDEYLHDVGVSSWDDIMFNFTW